jgi:hypothetical protein
LNSNDLSSQDCACAVGALKGALQHDFPWIQLQPSSEEGRSDRPEGSNQVHRYSIDNLEFSL